MVIATLYTLKGLKHSGLDFTINTMRPGELSVGRKVSVSVEFDPFGSQLATFNQ